MDAQSETESLVCRKTIDVLQPNGLSSNHIDGRRTPNLHCHPATVVLENNFPEGNPPVFCKFHRQWVGACYRTFDCRYNSVWFEIVNAGHAHGLNMNINRYQSLFRFLRRTVNLVVVATTSSTTSSPPRIRSTAFS